MPDTKDWIELAKIAQSDFHSRRSVEWKLAFGFWTGIGILTSVFFTRPLPHPLWLEVALALAYVGILFIVIRCWQIPLHTAHAGDRQWKHYYQAMARGEIASPPTEPYKWSKSNKYWCVGQCVFSAILLLISWVAITQIAPR